MAKGETMVVRRRVVVSGGPFWVVLVWAANGGAVGREGNGGGRRSQLWL